MTIKNIQNNESNIWKNPALILILLLGIGFVVANILIFGRNDSQTIFVNTILNPILALLVTILAISLMRQASQSPRARTLWIGLILGWGLWTIAEVIWTIAFLQGQEAPYPGWADLFWCVGYFFLYLALWLRSNSITGKINRSNRIILVLVSVLMVAFIVVAILIPSIQAYDPSLLLESIINLFYPLADMILLVLALSILFTANKGTFSQSWLWIALGFILISFSDLYFTYLSVQDLYYPDGHVNFMSVFLVDVPYTISYMLFLVGLISLSKMRQRPMKSINPQEG
jgi:diguanylate cyclase